MTAEYLGLLVLLLSALLLIGALSVVHRWLAPKPPPLPGDALAGAHDPLEEAPDPLEGPSDSRPRHRHAVRFYVVAILFLLFNSALPFLYPWAAAFRELGWPGFIAMLLFVLPLLVGLLYEWRKGALDW